MSSKIKLPKGLRGFNEEAARKFANGGDASELIGAFIWDSAPQGDSFWCSIYRGGATAAQVEEGRRIVRQWLGEVEPKARNPRRESLTARIATAIQTGQNKPAMDTAREVMRIIDNHQRAKRRKEGK